MGTGPLERVHGRIPTVRVPDLTGLPEPAGPPDLSSLPDLTGVGDLADLTLEELLDGPNPVLARAARRVLDRLAAEEAPLAAYDSSAVPTDDHPV
ncbi:FxSxx-COOH cyclophane-containing RiPP peptide [Streptomyces sp. NPDC059534]|uniref:FxSxx-COOH cyclophane-containing RiPP peptide n=1 Tax=Streptomyces sp. NPDC059534 TaxID=3346859 RepID=UPI0036B81D5F